ncbi:MAG: hypothetical protein KDD69_15905 [Bdellovibrionales bacterium]|nr:hypothetical protein [Bdellovibrionales bacterium]
MNPLTKLARTVIIVVLTLLALPSAVMAQSEPIQNPLRIDVKFSKVTTSWLRRTGDNSNRNFVVSGTASGEDSNGRSFENYTTVLIVSNRKGISDQLTFSGRLIGYSTGFHLGYSGVLEGCALLAQAKKGGISASYHEDSSFRFVTRGLYLPHLPSHYQISGMLDHTNKTATLILIRNDVPSDQHEGVLCHGTMSDVSLIP